MSENLKIGFEEVKSALTNIKVSRKNLSEAFEEINLLIEDLPKCYGGTCGEKAYENLKKHSSKHYESCLNSFDTRINFIEKAVEAYEEAENERIAKIEEMSEINM